MSSNNEEEKLEAGKSYPLDLAAKIAPPGKASDAKASVSLNPTPLRNVRIVPGAAGAAAIINNKPGGNLIQRQITLQGTTSPTVGSSPHVPRGAAVVASLAPPRSSITATIRAPMIGPVTAPPTTFVRPARTSSPAQAAAWLSGASNTNGRSATLIPAKTTQVVGKQQVQSSLLQSAITAQPAPARTQTLVYSNSSNANAARISLSSTQARVSAITTTSRPLTQVGTAKLAVPVAMNTTRLLAPQTAVLTSTTRLNLPTTPPTVAVGRLAVTVTNPSTVGSGPVLTQIRTALVHPTNLVASRLANSPSAKIVTQPAPATIQLAPIAGALKKTIPLVTNTTRANTSQTAIVTQRQTAILTTHPAPIPPKVYTHQEGQPAGIYQLHAPITHTAASRTSPGPATAITVPTTTVSYSIYDSTFPLTRALSQQTTTISAATQLQSTSRPAAAVPQAHSTMNPSMRFNPLILPEQNRALTQVEADNVQNQQNKTTASPRPSILRKREHDAAPLKAAKNLIPSLSNMQPLSPPSRPDSRNNGHSSGGSTTISATSSPGLADGNDDSNQHMPLNKDEEENRPPMEMSPRKKPRKQNLTGNDMDENNEDMQFISERDMKRERDDSDYIQSDGAQDGSNAELRQMQNIRKSASASLLNSYHQSWKTTNNHYLRYSDVRPKEERKPNIIDLSNQHRVLDKINGWKIHHLSTQMEDLAEQENMVHHQLGGILKFIETQDMTNPDINRITELIKGNMQRVKIINDGMVEAKTSVMKIFEHKVHVSDIINRCASKRNYKKREKS